MTRAFRAGLLFTAIFALVLTTIPAPIAIAGDNADHATFSISGMTCGGCEASVERALGALAGVVGVQASHERNSVTVELEDGATSREQLARAIEDAGFDVVS